MAKIQYSLRRLLLPCFTAASSPPTTSAATSTSTKKRLSTSLRDDVKPRRRRNRRVGDQDQNEDASSSADSPSSASLDSVSSQIPPRPSKSMVICTFFGQRRSHVWFCVQIDRLSSKPSLLLELSISTQNLIKEMESGIVRIALECDGSDIGPCPLHSIPFWTMYCNGRKIGFASRRKASDETRLMLKKMQSMTVGAGVIPSGPGSRSDPDQGRDVMYMRANYEWVVGGGDSESYHLINPDDDCPGQDLSVFLFRSRR